MFKRDIYFLSHLIYRWSEQGTYLMKGGRDLSSGLSDSTLDSFPFTNWWIMIDRAPSKGNCLVETQKTGWVVHHLLCLLVFWLRIYQAFRLRHCARSRILALLKLLWITLLCTCTGQRFWKCFFLKCICNIYVERNKIHFSQLHLLFWDNLLKNKMSQSP